MQILVTGANGQVGNELKLLAKEYPQYTFFFTTKEDLDITKLESLQNYCKTKKLKAIINTAAYTNVEKAEGEEQNAYNVNVVGVKNLVSLSKNLNLRLIHISTDYVFDGESLKPYSEEDKKNPLSIYGKTKADGEEEILNSEINSLIIRTSWVYSYFGNNFFKTILRLATKQEEIKIVSDQIGTPTWAKSLAKVCIQLLEHPLQGILHYSNEGLASWYDFAFAIIREMNLSCKVIPIFTHEYPTKAKRPKFSVLDKSKYHKIFGYANLHWLDCVKEVAREFQKSI